MNYLITGGCGFIGVNLARTLLRREEGCRVRVLDNLTVGTKEALGQIGEIKEVAEKDLSTGPASRMELVVADVRDRKIAERACRGVDALIHLAANTGVIPSIEDPGTDCVTNVIGTFHYLEAARLNSVKRFIFASSGAPLGEQKPPIHEEMVPRPISPYGASKLCGEAYCSAYYGSYGLETVVLRFGNVYGPHSTHKGSVVAKFIKHVLVSEPLPIYGDGNQTRDFVYVEDLVEAVLLAVEKPGIGGQVFQIATHQEHTVGEVAEGVNAFALKFLGRSSPVVYEGERTGEVRRNFSDIAKARRMLGFEPKYDLKTGLEKTFLWFLEQSGKEA
jgi:UDP-glucose 4-epimerase